MKTKYICEKCGASFDEYSDCYNCEDSHIQHLDWLNDEDVIREGAYKKHGKLPSTVHLAFRSYEADEEKLTIAKYQLVDELPEESEQRTVQRREANERSRREWEERRAAEKAAKETAEAENAEETA